LKNKLFRLFVYTDRYRVSTVIGYRRLSGAPSVREVWSLSLAAKSYTLSCKRRHCFDKIRGGNYCNYV